MQRQSIDNLERPPSTKHLPTDGSRGHMNSTINQITGLKYNPFKCPANLDEARTHRVSSSGGD